MPRVTAGSDALTRRHNVRLRVVSDAGLDVFSDEGYVFTQIPAPTRVTLLAENLNLRKSLAMRLVSKKRPLSRASATGTLTDRSSRSAPAFSFPEPHPFGLAPWY